MIQYIPDMTELLVQIISARFLGNLILDISDTLRHYNFASYITYTCTCMCCYLSILFTLRLRISPSSFLLFSSSVHRCGTYSKIFCKSTQNAIVCYFMSGIYIFDSNHYIRKSSDGLIIGPWNTLTEHQMCVTSAVHLIRIRIQVTCMKVHYAYSAPVGQCVQ